MSNSLNDELAPYVRAAQAVLRAHNYPTDEAALLEHLSRQQREAISKGLRVPQPPPNFVNDCLAVLTRARWISEAAQRGDESSIRWNLRCLGADGARLSVFPLVEAEAGRDAGRHAGGRARKGKTKIENPREACREYLEYRRIHPTISARQALEKIAKRHGISRSTLTNYIKKSAST
jgi:hypothetical protein